MTQFQKQSATKGFFENKWLYIQEKSQWNRDSGDWKA